MNSKQILAALNGVSDEHILTAQKILGYDVSAEKAKRDVSGTGVFRRPVALVAAVILLLGVLFTTAFAISDGFRDLVFSFFSGEEPEILPETGNEENTPGNMAAEEGGILLGGVVEGTYIRFPTMSSAGNGVFRVCTDDVQMNSGSHYDAYYEEDGEFIRLEEHAFHQVYHLFGHDIPVEFQWAEYNNDVIITYMETEAPFVRLSGSGAPSSTLMLLAIDPPGEPEYGYYPVLVNLWTGELMDVCEGMGVENLPHIRQAALSQDQTQMLVVDWDGMLYYADLAGGKLYSLDELLGTKARACALAEGKLILWSEMYGTCSVRVYDPETWEFRETYVGNPEFIDGLDASIRDGHMYRGTRFALEVDGEGAVTAIDLLSGARTTVEGLEITQEKDHYTECVPSPDGTKLLIYTRGQTSYYETIGVLDFYRKAYVTFSRENARNVNEHAVYWFAEDSVMVEAQNPTEGKEYYLYRIVE